MKDCTHYSDISVPRLGSWYRPALDTAGEAGSTGSTDEVAGHAVVDPGGGDQPGQADRALWHQAGGAAQITGWRLQVRSL